MWNEKPNERLNIWRDFRNNLDNLVFEEAIAKTTTLWSYAPFINTFLPADLINDWPDPWQLVYDNQYDNLAIALGMFYTLVLSHHKAKYEIVILREPGTSEIFNTVYINDGEYILNYEFNEVLTKQDINNEVVAHRYSTTDLKLDNL